jgi:hypothetical protein
MNINQIYRTEVMAPTIAVGLALCVCFDRCSEIIPDGEITASGVTAMSVLSATDMLPTASPDDLEIVSSENGDDDDSAGTKFAGTQGT